MTIRVKIGDVRLNPNGHYKKCILIENDKGGLLCIDPELFSIYFEDKNNLGNVKIINVYDKFVEKL